MIVIANARETIADEKVVQVFDFSCTLCLTVKFSHP